MWSGCGKPVVKSSFSVQTDNLFTQEGFDAVQVLIRLGQFLAGIAENVFHVLHPVAHVKGKGSAVFAAGHAENVASMVAHCGFCGSLVGTKVRSQ